MMVLVIGHYVLESPVTAIRFLAPLSQHSHFTVTVTVTICSADCQHTINVSMAIPLHELTGFLDISRTSQTHLFTVVFGQVVGVRKICKQKYVSTPLVLTISPR